MATGEDTFALAGTAEAEQQRRLRSMMLNDTLQPFKLENEASSVDYKVDEKRQDYTNVLEYIDKMEINGDADGAIKKQIKINALGALASNPRNQTRTVRITEKANVYDGKSLDKFTINLDTTDVKACLGEHDEGDFKRAIFESTFHRTVTRNALLDLAIFKAMRPLGNDATNEERADRNTLITNLLQEKASSNIALETAKYETQLEQQFKANIVRQSNISSTVGQNLIQAPKIGATQFVPPDLKKSINQILGHTTFGSQQNTKPLREYLSVLNSCVSGIYSESAIYDLLIFMLSGTPRHYVICNRDRGIKLETCFTHLQLSFNKRSSVEDIQTKIRNLLATRPTCPNRHISLLVSLIYEKNSHYPPSEKYVISDNECKGSIFALLYKHYPQYYALIKRNYENIVQTTLNSGLKLQPADIVLNALVADTIGTSPAARNTSRTHDVKQLEVDEDPFTDVVLQENDFIDMINDVQSAEATSQKVEAFQSNGNRPNTSFQRNGAKPKNPKVRTVSLPEHLRNKCFLCAGVGHGYKKCPRYPNAKIGSACKTCPGMHYPLPCYNSNTPVQKVYEVDVEDPESDIDDSASTVVNFISNEQ